MLLYLWLSLVFNCLLCYEGVVLKYSVVLKVRLHVLGVNRHIKLITQIFYYFIECVVFLLHFLMMAAALLSLPGPYKICHRFKYFVHSPQMFMNKMLIVHFQKPVISFILLRQPMP